MTVNASQLRIVAIPTDIVDGVRATMRAPTYGHPAFAEVATGTGPCRHCLAAFEVGAERRILFTHDRFATLEHLPHPGPVWVHETGCTRYAEDAGFPEHLRLLPLTLEAYARGRRLLACEYTTNGNVEIVLQRIFADPAVDYVHVINTEAGCYDFRVERA